MLVSVRLEIVLILTQVGCTVWVERTIRSEIAVRCTRWIYVTLVMWNVISVHLETVLVSVQDGYTVRAKRTIGIEIILDAPNGTSR
jgi:uncharacterized protein with PQ loop repeat